MVKTVLIALAFFVSAAISTNIAKYPNFSFDYSAHEMPLFYTSYGNAVELNHNVKLNSLIEEKGGAYSLDAPIEFKEIALGIEFTINSDLETARGFQTILSKFPFD